MSAERVIRLTCDDCGNQEDFDATSKAEARAQARSLGVRSWRTGLKATTKRPSMYDTKVDLCPSH